MGKCRMLFFFIALAAATVANAAEFLPQGVIHLIPAGYRVMAFQPGDLNRDFRIDYLVALHRPNEKAIGFETGNNPSRPLVIYIQSANGQFTNAARNDNVIHTIHAGGQCDPFDDSDQRFSVSGNYFTVQNSVACGQHWSDYITFRYDPKRQNWLFHKRITESWVLNSRQGDDQEALIRESRSVVNGRSKRPELFAEYQPD